MKCDIPFLKNLLVGSDWTWGKFQVYLFAYLAVSGLCCSTRDLPCIVWDLLWWCTDAGLCNCGSWAHNWVVEAVGLRCSVACGILIPLPGVEPMFPALQGEFLTTGPPGKSQYSEFLTWDFKTQNSLSPLICLETITTIIATKNKTITLIYLYYIARNSF